MVTNRSKTEVVCDAGPIIHLDELDCLKLMGDFARVFVPDVVKKEVLAHRRVKFDDSDVRWIEISHELSIVEPLKTICQIFSLGAGEIASLAFMSKEHGLIFLTDDAAARLVATKLGYNVHGTIGVLIRAIRKDLMKPEEVINKLNRIPQDSTLYLKPSLLKEIISLVRQQITI